MADPATLAVVGATAGAILNPNDPVKGAVIGGTLGYGGGAAFGAGGASAVAPVADATYAAGAPVIEGLTAQQAVAAGSNTPFVPTLLGGPTPTIMSGLPSNIGSAGSVASGGFGNTVGTSGLLGSGGSAASAGLTPFQQLTFANQLIGRNQQAQQRLPAAPAIQSRPYTGMKQPFNAQAEEERRRMMYAMPPMPQIRLI